MQNQKGFTIIELIVVIAIIAVLASIVMVNVTGYISKARDARRMGDSHNIQTALAMYFSEHGVYPPGDLLSGQLSFSAYTANWAILTSGLSPYISHLPVDPTNNDVSGYGAGAHFYMYYLNPSPIVNGYALCVSLENPKSSVDYNPLNGYAVISSMGGSGNMFNQKNGGVCAVVGQ